MSKHFNLTKIKQLTYHLLTALTLLSQSWGTPNNLETFTEQEKYQRNNLPILIVEDTESLITVYSKFLKKSGFENVKFARNIQEALSYLNPAQPFRVIISDYDLGEAIDGSEFCELLIKSGLYSFDSSITKVFAHSSTLTDESKQKFIKAGVPVDNIFEKGVYESINTIIKRIIEMIHLQNLNL